MDGITDRRTHGQLQNYIPLTLTLSLHTVNLETFARILFSGIALKDIIVTLKVRNIIYMYQ